MTSDVMEHLFHIFNNLFGLKHYVKIKPLRKLKNDPGRSKTPIHFSQYR